MSVLNWIKIILWIIKQISSGSTRSDAVAMASAKFGVSENSIRERGGF